MIRSVEECPSTIFMLTCIHSTSLQAFAAFVENLYNSDSSTTIFAPSFSHTKKDPIPNDIAILPSHTIIIIEGLYANVDEGAWSKAAALYDERWVIECPESLARARLIERHVVTGVAQSKEEAEWRGEFVGLLTRITY